jgi:hypothetical protein
LSRDGVHVLEQDVPMLVSLDNPIIDKLMFIAGGDLDLVCQAIDAAALRNFIHNGKDEADLLDVVNYITTKTGQRSLSEQGEGHAFLPIKS